MISQLLKFVVLFKMGKIAQEEIKFIPENVRKTAPIFF